MADRLRVKRSSRLRRPKARLWIAAVVATPVVLIIAAAILLGLDWRQQRVNAALLTAIEHHQTAAALALLERGASANAERDAPVHTTLVSQLQHLWESIHGAARTRQPSGPTALLLAVQADDATVAEALLRRHVRYLHVRDSEGASLARLANEQSSGQLVHLLWDYRAFDPDDLPVFLFWAASHHDVALASASLARGAPVNGASDEPVDEDPLYAAADCRDWEMMRLLLAHGASVNGGGDGTDYAGALSLAAERNDFPLVRFLLAHGADVNAEVRFGSALTKAAEAGNVEMARLLLAHKADPNIGDYHNELSTEVADKPRVLRLLLRAGANPNADAFDGRTLLGIAASNGDAGSVNAVLAAGGKINRPSEYKGTTALMDASAAGQLPIVRLLLRRGANVNARVRHEYYNEFRWGGTAVDVAIQGGHAAVARLLRRHGGRRAAELGADRVATTSRPR
jgi:ankyrin repeat protein